MIKPLQLGKTIFPTNMIQGPLAGISCAPFRRLIWRYSTPAYTCTEMISCKTIIHQPMPVLRRYVQKDPTEGPVCFQLSGSEPKELAEATKRITDHGADLIDLNCGCPVKKIRDKGAGSRLLSDAQKLYHLISAMKNNTHVPVSIKIRVDGASHEKCNSEVAKVVSEAGADFLVVHGRHWTEHYETSCHYDEIQYFVNEVNIPVIGNGDVACMTSLNNMLATGCAGVMIGRAGVGQPWIIDQLQLQQKGLPINPRPPPEIGQVFIEHIEHLKTLLQSELFAILQARKLAKYYAKNLVDRVKFLTEMNHCQHLYTLRELCKKYFCIES